MSNMENPQHAGTAGIATIHNGNGHTEHTQSFWTKYIFSQDHKSGP
jgi:cytochrome c oxidase subunit I